QSFMGAPRRPDVDDLRNLSAAIVVDQERMAANSRSTVGTATDTYTRLRVMFSRLGTPFVGGPNRFSFNDPQGMCPTCEGSGRTSGIDLDALIDRSKSLDEGPILFPGYAVDSWPWQIFADSGFFDRSKPLADYSDDEMQRFLYGDTVKVKVGTMNLTYEGLVSKIRRSYLSKDPDALQPHIRAAVDRFAVFIECPDCNGARLAPEALACRIAGRNIADCAAMQISDLAGFLDTLELDESAASVGPMRDALRADLQALVDIGLGYLSLNRPAATLSGGEAQRVKMVRHVGSPLTDLTYVFDEPTVGLHAHDIERMNHLLLRLRDKGNTVLVVEHKPAVMRIADHIVDLGPGAGSEGGRVMFEGPYDGLRRSGTVTGEHLGSRQSVKTEPRSPTGRLRIEHASTHNLRNVSVDVPLGVLTAVTGVAGSGKSTLVHQHLVAGNDAAGSGMVTAVDQAPIRGSRRSNPGTYTGVLDGVRAQFAKAHGVKPGLFSFNSDGACPGCSGLGMVYSDLVFMAGVASLCEQCEGKRFTPEVLAM
ncbi:MAG: excinuclease ABC subunit UvrA, partial [Actinomycetota bacterium]|nr:excinuclease ABC subunit UvrA [Actinomycetota bacterium]